MDEWEISERLDLGAVANALAAASGGATVRNLKGSARRPDEIRRGTDAPRHQAGDTDGIGMKRASFEMARDRLAAGRRVSGVHLGDDLIYDVVGRRAAVPGRTRVLGVNRRELVVPRAASTSQRIGDFQRDLGADRHPDLTPKHD